MRLSLLLRSAAIGERVAKELIKYGNYSPTPMSLSRMLEFGRSPCQNTSFTFLRHELPVRVANIMQEIQLLPEQLLAMPSMQVVAALHEQSFAAMLPFTDEPDVPSPARLQDFTDILMHMLERHRDVVMTMAHGVLEMKEKVGIDQHTEALVHYFLDRFYMSRISIRMIISQHVLMFGPDAEANSADADSGSSSGSSGDSRQIIGSIDSNCDVMTIVHKAYDSARFLCEQFYLTSPSVSVQTVGITDSLHFTYVPAHLYHIVFEIFKNSMRALVEKDEESMPPIEVLVCAADEDLTIRISDRGGGIKRSQLPLVFQYMYTTADPVSQSSSTGPPLAGYGYGLPLSRVYARYLHGDLQLSSVEGFGTDAFIFLKRSSDEASELLPVFNMTSAKYYSSNLPVADWCSVSN